MRGLCFAVFVIFSMVLCLVLVDALNDYGFRHTCVYFGLLALALLLRGGFRLFYQER